MSIRILMLIFVLICVQATSEHGHSQLKQPGPDERVAALEAELHRLRLAEASMGEQHPKLPALRQTIVTKEAQLAELRAQTSSLKEFAAEPAANRQLVEQISDAELRWLVIRLATEVRRLDKRVDQLEEQLRVR